MAVIDSGAALAGCRVRSNGAFLPQPAEQVESRRATVDGLTRRQPGKDATATNVWHWTTYPNLGYEIVYPEDISMAPWLQFPASPVCKRGGGVLVPTKIPKSAG